MTQYMEIEIGCNHSLFLPPIILTAKDRINDSRPIPTGGCRYAERSIPSYLWKYPSVRVFRKATR